MCWSWGICLVFKCGGGRERRVGDGGELFLDGMGGRDSGCGREFVVVSFWFG